MGLFSGDSSSTSNTNNFDQRKVLSGGSVDSGGGSVTVTDGGSVANAVDLAKTTVSRNVDLSAFTTNRAVDLAAFTVDANGKTVDKALNFGSDALSGALSTVKDTVKGAFNFGSDALSGALTAVDKSQTKAFNFGSDSLASAYDFANKADNRANSAQSDALSAARDSMAAALGFGAKQTAVALDSLQASNSLVKNAYEDAKGRGAMTDYILLAAIGLAALVAFNATRH